MTQNDAYSVRIVHVVASLDPAYGGPSALVPPLCDALAQRGHDVTIVTTDRGVGGRHMPQAVTSGGAEILVARQHWPKTYGTSFGLAPILWRLLPRADVVEIHSIYLFHTLLASRLARARKVPYVVRPHGTLDHYHYRQGRLKKAPYEFLIERATLRRAAAVHCLSERERQGVLSHGFHARVEVVPAGIDRPDDIDEPSKFEPPFLLFLGRITAKKNVDVLLRAFATLPAATRPRLVVAGPDNEGLVAGLLRLAEQLGVSQEVDFIGPVYGADKWALLQAATLFVLPSQDESFGVAVLESLVVGTPVVVSPDVALADEVAATRTGWVVTAEPAALAETLAQVLSDAPALHAAGRAAAQAARTLYTWSRIGALLEALYVSVTKEP